MGLLAQRLRRRRAGAGTPGATSLAVAAVGVIALMLVVFPGHGAASSRGAAGPAAVHPTLIRFVSTNVILRVEVDKLPKGKSKGDTIFTSNVLTNAVAQLGQKKGDIAGSDAGRTMNVDAVPTTVNVLVTLKRGTLRVRGVSRQVGKTRVMPVVSGTGQFKGAKGSLTVAAIPLSGELSNVYRLRY